MPSSMARQIQLQRVAGRRPPFDREVNQERLSITIHEDADTPLVGTEAAALAVLREFSYMTTIDVIDTKPGTANHVEFSEHDPVKDLTTATVRGKNGDCKMGVHAAAYWPPMVSHFVAADPNDTTALLAQMPIMELHRQHFRHIFATNSRLFHALSKRFEAANVRTFEETAKILGLYLRSRDDFTWRVFPNGTDKIDREWFYSLLSSVRMPELQKFLGVWLRRSAHLKDNSEYLGSSVFKRGARILRARDEIGFAFFANNSNSKRDVMTYHFDYLTMLLTGAIDAQARIAHAVYEIRTPTGRYAAFHNDAFLVALKEAGAERLVAVADSDRFKSFRKLLWALRNTVHGTGLTDLTAEIQGKPRSSLLRVHGEDAKIVRDAAQALGNPADFGLTQMLGTEIEPYACALWLTDIGLGFVNHLAEAIDDERMLPAGGQPSGSPPASDDGRSEWSVGQKARIAQLG